MSESVARHLHGAEIESIRGWLYYDNSSPSGLRWRKSFGKLRIEGQPAGKLAQGYFCFSLNQSYYRATDLILLLNGIFPTDARQHACLIDAEGLANDAINLQWRVPVKEKTIKSSIKPDLESIKRRKERRFVDSALSGRIAVIAEDTRLSRLCPGNHFWMGQPLTLFKMGHDGKWECPQCKQHDQELYSRYLLARKGFRIRVHRSRRNLKPLPWHEVQQRFAQFDHRCAYCGCDGKMQIEHVVPISKGGSHAVGSIVPACKRCNVSKHARPVETWYRQQPFYSDLRWRKICRVLGWQRSSVGQLALL
jgi:5-methylcytosine-specific restriction endonuclease McrA